MDPGDVEAGACSKEPDGLEQVLGGSGLQRLGVSYWLGETLGR